MLPIGVKKMKLIILTKQFGNYTGATISTIELLKRINNKFNEVEIVTLKSDGTRIRNVKVNVQKNIFSLLSYLKKESKDPECIGYSDDHLGFLFSHYGIKYLHTYHGNWPDARNQSKSMYLKSLMFIPLYKATVRKASYVVSVSHYMVERFLQPLNKNIRVIYNGIKSNNSEETFSKKIGDSNKLRIVMVGNVDGRKYSMAVKLFEYIENKYINDFSVDVFGQLVDQNIKHELEQFSFVKLHGSVKKINYHDFDLFLCTSSSENLPVSIIESLKNMVPVVSFDVGGIPEVVNQTNGAIIQFGDIEKMSNVIINARKLPTEWNNSNLDKFTWDYAAKEYIEIFNKLKKD